MVWLLALPNWIKVAVAGVAVIGVLQVTHWIKVRGLDSQIERLEVELALEKGAVADLRIAVSDVSANRDKLTATIREQNAAVEQMRVEARQAETAANLRVARAIRAGEEEARKLRLPTSTVPPGHAAMNDWLRSRVGVD